MAKNFPIILRNELRGFTNVAVAVKTDMGMELDSPFTETL